MNARLILTLLSLATVACTTPRPIPDASPDVTLAPIDTGVTVDAALDGAFADQRTDDAPIADSGADATTSDAATDVARADGATREAGAARCDSDAGLGDGGCVLCPVSSAGLLNQCTNNGCARFDNARCGRLLPDGGLPPLP
jgi:hypothetical protein